jgi:hypothetical protein
MLSGVEKYDRFSGAICFQMQKEIEQYSDDACQSKLSEKEEYREKDWR